MAFVKSCASRVTVGQSGGQGLAVVWRTWLACSTHNHVKMHFPSKSVRPQNKKIKLIRPKIPSG